MAELNTTGEQDVATPASAQGISNDLPFELQPKLFEQLTTFGVAGAGLVITLRGSILSQASPLIWMGAIEFGLGALVALAAQMSLINGLFQRRFSARSAMLMTMTAVVLLGMGIGTLGTSVFLEGDDKTKTVPAVSTSPLTQP